MVMHMEMVFKFIAGPSTDAHQLDHLVMDGLQVEEEGDHIHHDALDLVEVAVVGSDSSSNNGTPVTYATGGGGGGGSQRRSWWWFWWFWYCSNKISNRKSESGSAKATGGAISFYGGKTIHAFTLWYSTSDWSQATVEYVVVGGGGAGVGGGGGAGGIEPEQHLKKSSINNYSNWWRWCRRNFSLSKSGMQQMEHHLYFGTPSPGGGKVWSNKPHQCWCRWRIRWRRMAIS